MDIDRRLSGGVGQTDAPNTPASARLCRLDGKATFCQAQETVLYNPQIHEWLLTDVLSGGACT